MRTVLVVPDDRNAVRRVFTGQAEHPRKAFGTDVLQANQTNAGDGVAIVKLWAERGRQLTLNHVRLDAKVDEQPSPDHTVNLRQFHARTSTIRCWSAETVSVRPSRVTLDVEHDRRAVEVFSG
jgi:hypothetical protein